VGGIMSICKNCGRNHSWAKADIKSGKVKDPDVCVICTQKLDAKAAKKKERDFEGPEIEVNKDADKETRKRSGMFGGRNEDD